MMIWKQQAMVQHYTENCVNEWKESFNVNIKYTWLFFLAADEREKADDGPKEAAESIG